MGGGEHDWFNILSRWNALEYDTAIAGALTFACWVGMAGVWWLAWRAWRHGQA